MMAEHLLFGEHMTEAPHDQAIRDTYLGQAHIAGTGPGGATCRECVFWRRFGIKKDGNGKFVEYVKPPAYFGRKHKTTPCELRKQYCTRPIINKAKRLIPHHAKACRLFEAAEHPPVAKREEH